MIHPQLRVGSRMSALAQWQTQRVIGLLQVVWPDLDCEVVPFVTVGDRTQALGKALPSIGGKGLFTAELENALRAGAIDIAVHSLKDLPVENAPDTILGTITDRADVRDGLVARNGWTLATLPRGALVGTGSTRRKAQLLAARPDLAVRSIRGNVGTRIRKVLEDGDYEATVLAAAGVTRLGMDDVVSEWLPLETMLPAPGQGALAVQCRQADAGTREHLAAIHHGPTAGAVRAERAFLAALGGGCSAPVAAYARWENASLQMVGLVGALDGSRIIRVQGQGSDGATLGRELAEEALRNGAAELLIHE